MTGATATPALDLSPAARRDRMVHIDHPTKRTDAWRYAPHDTLARLSFGAPTAACDVPAAVDDQLPVLDGPRIVMVNGVVDAARSDLSALPEGLRVSTLADALHEQPQQLAAHFDGESEHVVDAFVALNIAFTGDGAVIRVDDGHDVETPIHIVDVVMAHQAHDASCTGVVIDLGRGSSATVVETRIGGGNEVGGSNARTTITLGDNSTLEHIVLQDAPSTQIHLGRIEVTQGAGSVLHARSFNLGGFYGRVAYDVQLAGEGARADLSGLYFGLGDQTLDQQINVVHGAKNCTSRQSYRGVLDDQSTGVFNGGIEVRPGADGTDAEQANDNLLLSDRAEVNTQPRLEILADDVACKHGATVGQLDDTALYYLRSRGIPAEEARRLLINGFADQAVDEIGIDSVRTWITDRLGHAHE